MAITNASTDPDLQAALAPYGYDAEALAGGQALVGALSQAQAAQQRGYGRRYDASATATAAFKAARALYMRHLKLARIVFAGDPGRTTTLAMAGRRAESRPGLLEQARLFYFNVLADEHAVTALAEVNAGREALEAGQAAVQAAEVARAVHQQETGQAQESTVARDAAAAALRKWFSRFVRIAKLATDGTPQLRERLGILERS